MPQPSSDDLWADNQRLRDENQSLRLQLEQLQRTVDQLRGQLEAATQAAKRQTAPFSKGPPKAQPKTPGRKAGDQHGDHAHRAVPPPEAIDEIHDAPLPLLCPDCGGTVVETHVDQQYQTDIPRRPIMRQFDIHCGQCAGCGRHCRGRHPLQTSDATGAAASQLGADAQAAVVVLNKDAGLSYGKVRRVFDHLFGITLTRGACAQIVLRAARRLRPAYAAIQERVAGSTVLGVDETSWRVGGYPAWLHAWVADAAVCYVIHPRRSADALEAVIGSDYDGVLIHDGFASYDRFVLAAHQQCLAHPLRRAHELEQRQTGAACRFPRQVIAVFQEALGVRDAYESGAGDETLLAVACERLAEELEALTNHPRTNAENERLRMHLWAHGDHWWQFLRDPEIAATNNATEQALRPAVVNRKVWGGNRTETGAAAQGIVMSVLQTCRQRAVEAFEYIRATLCHGVVPLFIPQPEPQGR